MGVRRVERKTLHLLEFRCLGDAFQMFQQQGCGLRDGAGTEREQKVASGGVTCDAFGGLLQGFRDMDAQAVSVCPVGVCPVGVCPVGGYGGGERVAGDAGQGLFAGGINGNEFQGVGLSKSGGELVKQVAGAGVAVGLEENMDVAVAALAGGGKGGTNFSGVVAVVVDHGDAVCRAFVLKAAVDTTKAGKSLGDLG